MSDLHRLFPAPAFVRRALCHICAVALLLTSPNSAVSVLTKEERADAEKLYDQTFEKGSRHQRVRDLSQAQRDFLSEYLRTRIEEQRRSENGVYSITVLNLALLGDDWAREEVVKMFWKEPRANAVELKYLADPKVISVIGDGLFMEEDYYRLGDVGFGATQDNIASAFVYTLCNSPEFNADVTNWARRVNDWSADTGSIELKIVREWYRANEAKLKAGDFKAVQPGAEPPARRPWEQPEEMRPAAELAWAAALLASCGITVWFWKRRRR